jgi:hypothetical protein
MVFLSTPYGDSLQFGMMDGEGDKWTRDLGMFYYLCYGYFQLHEFTVHNRR